jgi:hypothetical protein
MGPRLTTNRGHSENDEKRRRHGVPETRPTN